MLKLLFSGITDPGLLRSSNQDDYYIDPQGRFFIVADGMGGHAGGQEASQLATHTIRTCLEEQWDSPVSTPEMLCGALDRANQNIVKDQKQHPERADMGTTAVVLVFRARDQYPWCAHIGDSRLYRFRDSEITQITEDHTWIARAVREGELTVDQSRVHPWRHVLSQCLGREDMNKADVQAVEAQIGDRFLLCSDGLTEELPDPLIASHLMTIQTSESAARTLIQSAKQRGGRDNITVVLVTLLPVEESPQEESLPTTGFITTPQGPD